MERHVPSVSRTEVLMGTMVTIEALRADAEDAIDRAFDWFRRVEACCTRFNPMSELMQLTTHVGADVDVSPMLYEAVQFALAVAEETDGAFDPTVGHEMEARGFNREYSTGRVQETGVSPTRPVSFRDVHLDPARRTIRLTQPLVLDLGGVAKGLAIDTAARELERFKDFAIDAGGDLYLGGHNASGEPWSVGIRHPRLHDQTIETIRVSDTAVCTSGDYERWEGRADEGHHILDPRDDGGARHRRVRAGSRRRPPDARPRRRRRHDSLAGSRTARNAGVWPCVGRCITFGSSSGRRKGF